MGSNRFQVQVHENQILRIREMCNANNMPLIEEYDFRKDNRTPDLKIELKSTTIVRDYQERSLSKMFSNGRARSGIIVLPCGAGKTLTGIAAASHIKKSVMVLCNSNVSVEQWRQQFYQWAKMDGSPVVAFTSKENSKIFDQSKGEAGVVVSTYFMIAYQGTRNPEI